MLGIVMIVAVFASAILIAVADALVKATSTSTFAAAVWNPWMLVICGLYFIQILLAVYIFVHKGELAIYGNIFIVFYSISMVLLGVFVFHEHLSTLQAIGIVLALAGAVLLNSGL